MYTAKELNRATEIIKQIARENGVTEVQVRADMEETMNISRHSPDPTARARWATFQYVGEKPTIEEFILWLASMAKNS